MAEGDLGGEQEEEIDEFNPLIDSPDVTETGEPGNDLSQFSLAQNSDIEQMSIYENILFKISEGLKSNSDDSVVYDMILNWKSLLEAKIKNNDDYYFFSNYLNKQQENLIT